MGRTRHRFIIPLGIPLGIPFAVFGTAGGSAMPGDIVGIELATAPPGP